MADAEYDRRTGPSEPEPTDDEIEEFMKMAFVLGTSLLLPWIYFVLERANLLEFNFQGFNRSRALWLIPLFYIVAAAGTVLLFPEQLKFFWAFVPMILAQIGELAIHRADLLVGMSLPLTPRFTPVSIGGFVAVLGVAAAVSWPLRRWDTVRECQRVITDDQYALPLRSVEEASDRMRLSKVVSLGKDGSIGVVGEPDSGKTNTIETLVYQMEPAADEPVVVFEYKADYRRFLENEWSRGRDAGEDGQPEIVYLSPDSASVGWNIFLELEHGATIGELSRALFPRPGDGASEATAFFAKASRQLFVAVVTYLRGEAEARHPTNADLVGFVRSTDRDEMYDVLTESGRPDFAAARSALDPDAERQAAGVYADFQQQITDMFRGDFATEGEFSIGEFWKNPRGRILVLDVPAMQSESVKPIYRFFIDWAARHALSDDRNSYFVLDEFARLPRLRKLGDLINVGRGRRTQLILGVQSVAQVYATYGRDRGKALLSGLVQSIIMRVGDQDSADYARSQIGREPRHGTEPIHDRRGRSVGSQDVQDEEYPIAESDLTRLETGEAVVILPEGWIRGKIHSFAKIRKALARALRKIRDR